MRATLRVACRSPRTSVRACLRAGPACWDGVMRSPVRMFSPLSRPSPPSVDPDPERKVPRRLARVPRTTKVLIGLLLAALLLVLADRLAVMYAEKRAEQTLQRKL